MARRSPNRRPEVDAATPTDTGDAMSVSAVSSLVKEVIGGAIPAPLRVIGEVSNLSDRTHWFFSLKDASATLRCVMFASSARRVGFAVRDGMEVVASGRLDYYPAQGSLQMYVDRLEPVGQGALELRLRQLMEELRGLGYFSEERKRPLPLVPMKVAVVTSKAGAALQDVINTAGRRWAGCELLLVDVRVQGASAAPEIAEAIERLSRLGPGMGVEAIILTRGGGSIEDLWAFNERAVADAVYRCRLPIVAAIGHETDTTVAELVADVRCSTPTQAAMRVVPDAAALAHLLDQRAGRLGLAVRRGLAMQRQRLEAVARQPIFRRPSAMWESARDRLTALAGRLPVLLRRRGMMAQERLMRAAQALPMAVQRRIADAAREVEQTQRRLRSIGPAQVLRRGYSYTLGPDGRVVRSVSQVCGGERVSTVVSDGRFDSVVAGPGHVPSPTPAVPDAPRRMVPRSASRRRGTNQPEPGLFG